MIPALTVGPITGLRVWVVAHPLYSLRGTHWEIVAVAGTRRVARKDLKELRTTSYAHSRLVVFKLVRA